METEAKKGKAGRPRKWITPTQRTIQLETADLELIRNAAKTSGEDLNAFLVNCALDRAHEIKAKQRRDALLQDGR